MTSLLLDDLIAQIEIFNALELEAVHDYSIMEQELANPELRDTISRIRTDEQYHSKMCLEIIDFLKDLKNK